jgi:hypothetical protein
MAPNAALTDNTGTGQARYIYDPFGKAEALTPDWMGPGQDYG